MFNLEKKESDLFSFWANEHKINCNDNKFSLSFSPSKVGVRTEAKCKCGKRIDLTDYNK